ncbi:uncharacterized protein N0V89_009348 [Didymosphaeria variabile]|uniref:Uncharacterized protein n=1 Tax=Didymosphaeria variabile TaxID=1932322 RepID=A0A9W8XEW2_9PLEO|nr:uncharacterized protein N0V89_009348 [Didymosphaeria variabile]KAJ4347976.1 hypothetical protein N0V89_009348 [Didymosphaeria variabile]
MGEPSGKAATTPDLSKVCPFGILNVPAALEMHALLQLGTKEIHKRLREWLAESYLDGNMHLLQTDEPLGIRIHSVEDLGMLAGAYNLAPDLRRPKSSRLDNELYFYGQKPGREAAVAAGQFMQQYFKPGATPAKLSMAKEPTPREPFPTMEKVTAEEDAVAAGRFIQQYFKLEEIPTKVSTAKEPTPKGPMGKDLLPTVEEVTEESSLED